MRERVGERERESEREWEKEKERERELRVNFKSEVREFNEKVGKTS